MMKMSVSPFADRNGYPAARIDATLLLDLSRAGRLLLTYIIEQCKFDDNDLVYIPKVGVIEYYNNRISSKYATTININRGIKDLIANHVIAPSQTDEVYFINKGLLSK